MIITTNIRLPEEQWKALKILAIHEGTSVSALLRQAVAQLLAPKPALAAPPKSAKASVKKDPFFEAIGLGSGGPSDDSKQHDRYLYKNR